LLRIYLSGEVQVERDARLLRESTLGGPQGRFVLAYLVSERKRAVAQGELAEALWPESLPPSWAVALSAIISRLRSRLATLGLVRSHIIGNAFGCYQFSAPADTWVDLEAALAGVDAAEGFVAAGNPQAAYGPSLIATTILRRPFLAGDDGPWADARRTALAAALVRALDSRVEALAANGEAELALTHAREAVRMEPYRGARRFGLTWSASGCWSPSWGSARRKRRRPFTERSPDRACNKAVGPRVEPVRTS
jgi:SARP family transcriptional regulator, regulator of embCAB operon